MQKLIAIILPLCSLLMAGGCFRNEKKINKRVVTDGYKEVFVGLADTTSILAEQLKATATDLNIAFGLDPINSSNVEREIRIYYKIPSSSGFCYRSLMLV